MASVSDWLRSRLVHQACGNDTNLRIVVVASILFEVLVLLQALPTARAVVTGSEHPQAEPRGASFGEATHESATVLPKATFHAATTAPPSLEDFLAGIFFERESRSLDPVRGFLVHNVSVCQGVLLRGRPSRSLVPGSGGC